MNYQMLETHRRGSVEHVSLNRPAIRNAFNEEVIRELREWAVATKEVFPAVRVAVLSGKGKVFSAGADLEWMARTASYSQEDSRRDTAALADMLEALDTLPQALIARVQGAAIAGGIGLISVCDIVVAADTARFGFAEVKLGIVPAVISPYVLPKIGVSAARELFLSGERFSAARARDLGLVHAVVPDAQLDETVDHYVRELLESGPEAVAAAKVLIRSVSGRPPAQVVDRTIDILTARRASAEGQAGIRAFLDKRRPPWVE